MFPKARIVGHKIYVSSSVQLSGLGFSYDDPSEEQSVVHQLKYVVLKTPSFKKAHHLKIFIFSKYINMLHSGAERVKKYFTSGMGAC